MNEVKFSVDVLLFILELDHHSKKEQVRMTEVFLSLCLSPPPPRSRSSLFEVMMLFVYAKRRTTQRERERAREKLRMSATFSSGKQMD